MTDVYILDKPFVRRSFDRAARHYDAAAVLQANIRAQMLARLDLVKLQPKAILDAGCGTGAGSWQLQKRYPRSDIISLDFAPAMLRETQVRMHGVSARIRSLLGSAAHHPVCGDIEALPLVSESVDLLWSNLAIQWCNDLDRTFMEMHRVLRTEGLLMLTTFGPDTLKELRAATSNGHTHVSRFMDMHDIGDALVRAGFSAPVLDVEHYTLTYADVLSLMRDLKAIGAHNATQGRHRGLAGRGFLQKIAQSYEAFRTQGKLPATYEVVFIHAWKPAPILGSGASTVNFHPRKK
jgi:malonyl-CoA O-methyltransferase